MGVTYLKEIGVRGLTLGRTCKSPGEHENTQTNLWPIKPSL